MRNHFIITLEIETSLTEDEMCFTHDNFLGMLDGDTEIKGIIATSKIHLSRKNSPEKNCRGLKKAIKEHLKQISNGLLKDD